METLTSPPETFPGMDASIRWEGGVAFVAAGMGGASVRFDQPADEGGGGHGFTPIQMQLHALAACMATSVVNIMKKQRLAVQDYRIEAHGDRDAELPHPYTRIVLTHVFTGPNLRRASLEHVVALVDEKYCSISAILPRGLVHNEIRIEGDASEGPTA
jgi:putative redox protein